MKKKPISKPRPASTIILVRQREDGLQTYLLKRSSKSGFMAGNYVFPGGLVDPDDNDPKTWGKRVDINLDALYKELGAPNLTVEDTLSFGIAAIRETFEEAGVLFGRNNKTTAVDLTYLLTLRQRKDLQKGWFKKNLANDEWCLELSKLMKWAHWITPELMKYRFDTRFYVALMPENQKCSPDEIETTHGLWETPSRALAKNLSGEIPLSPPTVVTLSALSRFTNISDLKKAISIRGWGNTIQPKMLPYDKGVIILEPWDPAYADGQIKIQPEVFEKTVLDPHEPFSRIWYDGKLWRPVRNDT